MKPVILLQLIHQNICFYYTKYIFIGLKYPKNVLCIFESKITGWNQCCRHRRYIGQVTPKMNYFYDKKIIFFKGESTKKCFIQFWKWNNWMKRGVAFVISAGENRTRYQTGDSLADLYWKHVALAADAIQAGHSNLVGRSSRKFI